MRIAVVGAGIFGATIAWNLAEAGHAVTLFERENDILCGASFVNQYRLHRGYHYPRSRETALLSKQEETAFERVYAEAVVRENAHFYAIAREHSLSSANACTRMWTECGLEFEEETPVVLDSRMLEACYRVREALFDPFVLKRLAWEKLRAHKVRVVLGKAASDADLSMFDLSVVATYAMNNAFAQSDKAGQRPYQFEVCEKPVLELPDAFRGQSVVVLDGPFMCIDPLARSGQFVMGNVVHAIHATNIGLFPEIPERIRPLINRGVIEKPPVSNIEKFLDSASAFFPRIKKARHVGSMFTVRTVLPYREHDDYRPTTVERVSDRVVKVFSGKIGTCVGVAEQVRSIAKTMAGAR